MKTEARVIICGGRDYNFVEEDVELLNRLCERLYNLVCDVTIVVGGAQGADTWGQAFAEAQDWPCEVFKAEWDKYDKAAGRIRNAKMANFCQERPDILSVAVVMPGGRGTAHMVTLAFERDFDLIVEKLNDDKFHITRDAGNYRHGVLP